MAKKEIEESTIDIIVASIANIQSSIEGVQSFVISFKNDMHDKVNDIRDVLNQKIDEIRMKIESIEKSNKIIEKHDFEIEQLKINLNNLAEMARENKKDADEKIKKHCDSHEELIKTEINDTIKSFKSSVLTKIVAVVGAPCILLVVGKITGLLDKFLTFIGL